jgi:hypothetical protein
MIIGANSAKQVRRSYSMQLPLQYSQQTIDPENVSMWHHMAYAMHQSVLRVTSVLISVFPGLLAFILAVAIMAGLGVLLSYLLRRVLMMVKFDDRMVRTNASGIADWSPSHSPTALAGRVTFWGCVLLGVVIGIMSLDASYASGSVLSTSLLPYLSRYVGAILLLFAGNIIARFLARTVLIGAVNNQLQYARFLSMGVKWLVLVLTAAMALDHLQIGGTIIELAFGILFGGIVLTLSLAVGLGSRELVTRSLERTAERTERNSSEMIPPKQTGDPLRHF